MLNMGGEMKQLVLIAGVGMYRCNGKLAVCQCASLVEDHDAKFGQDIHIAGSFD